MNIINDHKVLSKILETSFDLIAYSDTFPAVLVKTDGEILALNPAGQKKLGFENSQNLAEIFGPRFAEFLNICSGSRESLFFRLNIPLKNGKEKEYRCEGSALFQGGQKAIILRFKDIERSLTEFNRVNIESRETRDRLMSEQRLQTVIDAAIDVIILSDAHGKIILANKAVEKLMGYTPEELIGQNVKVLMPSGFANNHDQYMENYRTTKTAKIIGIGREVVGLRKDGREFPINLSIGKSRFAGEIYYTGIIHDLTEYKEIEAQLQQSQKMEALGKLSGGVAHDFNNLLSVILGRLELAEEQLEDDVCLDHVKVAMGAADKGARLIDQLLSFSRQKHLQPEVLNIAGVVQEVVEMIRRLLGAHIEIKSEIKGIPKLAYADSTQLNNALINLATNARDAMPAGGVLTITVENIDDLSPELLNLSPNGTAKTYVRVAISDTGCGIPEEILQQVIEPFFTTKDVSEGTGLGLSMVHGYMSQTNGFMHIDSVQGTGTTVSLYFVAANANVSAEHS